MNRRIWVILLIAFAAIPLGLAADEIWLHFHFRAVPLRTIASTIPQRGLRDACYGHTHGPKGERVYVEPFGETLEKIVMDGLMLERDIFLVRGDDLTGAIDSTSRRVFDRVAADEVIQPNGGKAQRNVWVAFYLRASHSGPPAWSIQSVRCEGRSIIVRFYTPWSLTQRNRDMHPYWGWAPLGELAPGTYTLALINTSKNETLKRTVVVGEP